MPNTNVEHRCNIVARILEESPAPKTNVERELALQLLELKNSNLARKPDFFLQETPKSIFENNVHDTEVNSSCEIHFHNDE